MPGVARGGSAPRRWFTAAFRAYIDWLLAHQLLVVTAGIALTVFWACQLPALRVEIDPDANLPQDHPYIRALHVLETTFGEKNLAVVGLFPHDGDVFTPTFLAKIQRLTRRIRELPGLVPSSYLSVASPLVKSIEGRDETLIVRPVLEGNPATQSAAAEVRRRVFANSFWTGNIVSADGSATAIVANFRLTREMPGYPEIYERIHTIVEEENDGTFTAYYGGPVAVLAAMAHVTERTILLFPVAVLIIGLIHYEAFRTLQGMILPLVTALFAVAWSLGVMGFLRIHLDPFNTTTPILILAVAAGHAVQLLKRYYEEYDRTGDHVAAVRIALRRLGPVMIAAGSIAALSFLSLTLFATSTIRNFGLLTGFGIISALVIELSLIPALRALLPAPKPRDLAKEAHSGRALEHALAVIARVVAARPRTVVASAVIVLLAALGAATRLHVNTSLKRQFSMTHPVRVADQALNSAFAGTNTLIFIVEGPQDGALDDPAAIRAIADLQAFVARDPSVGKTISYVDLLREMHRAFTGTPDADLPTERAVASQYLFLYSLSGNPEDLDSQIDQAHRTAAVRAFMREDSTEYAERLIAAIREHIQGRFPPGFHVLFSGNNASNAALTEVMVRGKLLNIIQIALIIVLITSVMLRSPMPGLLVATPLAMAVAVNFGAMGAFHIPLDIVTSPIAAMAVGIGADYAIYFLFRFREELAISATPELALASALRTSGKAIAYVSSAITFGYLVLCLSGFVYHVELGTMVALAMLVSSISSLTVLPALILITRPAFLFDVRPATYVKAAAAR